jgi:hypothetical protein
MQNVALVHETTAAGADGVGPAGVTDSGAAHLVPS